MGSEELYINNIKNGIRGIKLGTKTPETAQVGASLNRLKGVNEGMYLDLMKEYKTVVEAYHKKNPKE